MSERLGFSKFALQVANFLQFMMQFIIHANCERYCRISRQRTLVFQIILQLVAKRIVHSEQQVEHDNPREIRFLYTMITMQCTLFFLI